MSDCNNLRPGARHIIELLEKLDQYLKTGLTPEEVEQLKLASTGKADAEIRMFDDGRMERLSELMEADKEGRVVILPCKPGTTVYRISLRLNGRHEIEERVFNLTYFDPAKYGKDYFLSREGAEKTLEAMRDAD